MKPSLKALLTTLAVALLAVAVLVPIAGASGSTPGGMMGSPSPWPTMMGTPTPTPSPSPTGNTWGDSWCGGGIWNGDGQWGGTGMWGTGSGMSWLTSNPDAMQAWLQLREAHQQALRTWYDTYKADLSSAEAQQALHDLWTSFWTDMKSFYETYANGATWTCPDEGMWGGWDMGGMMGGHDWDAPHVGHGLRRRLDDEPSRRLRPLARDAQQAHRRRERLVAAPRREPTSTTAQTALQTMRAPIARRSSRSTCITTCR